MKQRTPRGAIAALRQDLPFGKFIPNALTVVALCVGATAIRFAMLGHWQAAAGAIAIAAVLDTLDGRIARLLGIASKFGAQLDSLADLVSFGIAPSVLVYMWALYRGGGAGWVIALVFCVCSAIRLARFNVQSEQEADDDAAPSHHFTGVPMPAAACLALLPMLLYFQAETPVLRDPFLNGGWMAAVALLTVCRMPTVSLKNLYVPKRLAAPVIAVAAALLGCAIVWPWATLSAAALFYLGALPFGRLPPGPIRRSFMRSPEPPAA